MTMAEIEREAIVNALGLYGSCLTVAKPLEPDLQKQTRGDWPMKPETEEKHTPPLVPKLRFMGSNPAGYCEWACQICGVEFSLRWDGHAHDERAIAVDPWFCPYCKEAQSDLLPALMEALEKYGQHKFGCPVTMTGAPDCYCGFEAALKLAKGEQ